ncbi:MAG: DUF2103 domain-containing protein [Candidatus Parcubacteria bacterium]|nr:DUF2103 domain-containing protein [Candidatus Parcubacteria bacterium]
MKNKMFGGKIGGKHTTLIDAAIPLVDQARKLSTVRKITLNIIRYVNSKQGGPNRVKFRKINGGLQAKVRGNASIQVISIYCSEPQLTQKQLERCFSS